MKLLIIEPDAKSASELKACAISIWPNAEIVATTGNIPDSIRALAQHPDITVVFSCIELPDGLSFSIFDNVQVFVPIIFVTSHKEYAIKAFEYNCIGFLIKPVSPIQFQKIVLKNERLRWISEIFLKNLQHTTLHDRFGNHPKMVLTHGQDTILCDISNICYVQKYNDFVRVFMSDGSWGDKNCSISKLSEILSSNNFFRINRQILVNIDYIQKLTPRTEHECDIILKDPFNGEKFRMSHAKRIELLGLLADHELII